jgi:hypothetical protein
MVCPILSWVKTPSNALIADIYGDSSLSHNLNGTTNGLTAATGAGAASGSLGLGTGREPADSQLVLHLCDSIPAHGGISDITFRAVRFGVSFHIGRRTCDIDR